MFNKKERDRLYSRLYRLKNKDKKKLSDRNYYLKNKEKIKEKYRENNKKYRENNKKYRENNKEKIMLYKYYYTKKRYYNDLHFNLSLKLRVRLNNILRINKYSKKNKIFNYIGCDWQELLTYLGDKYCRHCGSRENITHDHIIPFNYYIKKCGGMSEENIYKVMNYKNIQWLCRSCNCSKNGNY